ncbi:hypothetical protein ACFSUD_07060 [Sulfitobacter aestuarii]|uniref:Lipoprotein n=1 Tax=Sulfitobacter aestuarii TaxID=2161676 RepID=A0ABW5U0A5_9RHOB
MIRLSLSLFFAALLVSACAPLNTYYRPGVPVGTLNRDTLACEVQALRDVPVATRIRRLPPEFVPSRRICNSAGDCRIRRGYYLPGEIISYDANEGLRDRVETQCMADQGYAPVSIPRCPAGIARAAPAGATRVLPVLVPESCVIRNRDGSFQIVTRG